MDVGNLNKNKMHTAFIIMHDDLDADAKIIVVNALTERQISYYTISKF